MQACTVGGFGGFGRTAYSPVEVRGGACVCMALGHLGLHGHSKQSGCGRVQVGPITFSQTKHAHEIVCIRTTKPSLLRKRLPIIVQILLTKSK